ncbi:MAG: DMP19 family protein [Prevotella sp.]|nr:DMP19 family protein [Prevotella sp.]
MIEVKIDDAALQRAAEEGMDSFLRVFVDATKAAIGGELTADTLSELTADQVTLLAWDTLHEEVMDGGFVQLIHNGYGPFIFKNPLAKALKLWGLRDLSKLIYDAHTLWLKHREEIERDCTDEEFMALFERFSEFDDLDDEFVENEEQWTEDIAHYVDEHIENFATIVA